MNTTVSPHVLYLSMDGLTDPLGQSQILPYVAGLSGRGYNFTIITFEKEARFKDHGESIRAYCNRHNIRWIPLTYHRIPPVVSTLYDLYTLRKTVIRLHRKNPFTLIHCRSYVTTLVGQWMKKNYGVKFIFDMRGFWADERVEGGLWNLQNPLYKAIYRFFKKKERQFLTEADHVVSLTRNAESEIESWAIHHAPITVIPTCVDLNLFDPKKIDKEDQQRLRLTLGLKDDDYVLLYLGSLGTWYLTNEMFDFFSALKSKKRNAKFLIVTGDKINLDSYIYADDVIVAFAPRNKVPLYISLAQASVCFIKPTFSKKASSATKMAEIMAMNVPVIVNEGWGDMDYFPKTNFTNFADLQLDKYSIRDSFAWIREQFSLEYAIARYELIYNLILEHKHGEA